MKGIVEKPQFDTSVFEVGTAIHIVMKQNNGFELRNVDTIITKATPLEIQAKFYNKREETMDTINIYISEVVDGSKIITFLKEDK